MNNFCKTLRLARKAKRLTYDKLAAKTGISTSTLGNYEKGLTEPTFVNVCRLSEVLEVSLDTFAGVQATPPVDTQRLSDALFMCCSLIYQFVPDNDRQYFNTVVDAAKAVYVKYGGDHGRKTI